MQRRRPSGWTRRSLLQTTGALAGGALLSRLAPGCGSRGASEPLNLLLIVVEDWNAAILGCYGHPVVETPRVDAFARSALRFSRAYCQSPVCNASRASFLTGLRPDSTRVFDNDDPMDERLPQGTRSLPELWSGSGRRALNVGKLFHSARHAGAQLRAFQRIELGQRPAGYAGISSGPRTDAPQRRPPRGEAREHSASERRQRAARFGDSGRPEQEELDGLRARVAEELLGELSASREPFLLSVGFSRPHVPLLAPRRYLDLYDPAQLPLPRPARSELIGVPDVALRWGLNYELFPDGDPAPDQVRAAIAAYYACVSFVDAQIGTVLDALDAHGLAERTAVVLFADHGFHLGDHGLWSKLTLFEAATRVPLVVRVPGAAAHGRVCDAIVELVDLLPTLAELCDFRLPDAIEGTSFAPLVTAPERAWKSAAFSLCSRGDGQWLGRSIRTRRHRYNEWRHGTSLAAELYDLEADPLESVNRIADPSQAALRDELARRLRAGWQDARPPAGS